MKEVVLITCTVKENLIIMRQLEATETWLCVVVLCVTRSTEGLQDLQPV